MSKRCCANLCYNSTLKNKDVHYFGFPKSEHYAKQWALAAGRDDLLNKPLLNIIKYFLCSAHFENDCFIDPPTNSILKKTTRPLSVPIPTIFESNIELYIPKDPIISLENRPNSKSCNEEDSFHMQNVCSIPDKFNKEIEYITDNNEIDIDSSSNIYYYDVQESNDNADDCKEYYIDKNDYDTVNTAISSQSTIENSDENSNMEIFAISFFTCRLCVNDYTIENLNFFQDDEDVLRDINKLMPHMDISKGDRMPQQVCMFCYEKVKNCLNTINWFEAAQSKYLLK